MSAREQVRNLEGSSELKTAVMLYGDEQMCSDDQQREEAEEAAQEYLDLLARVAAYEDFQNSIKEAMELHPSHWEFHLKNDLDNLEPALVGAK